jgi:hypothetical protein
MDLPWKDVIDEAEFATSLDSYQASVELCRQGLLVGPSSGLALIGANFNFPTVEKWNDAISAGLYHFLEKAKANGGLDKLRGPDGKIKCELNCLVIKLSQNRPRLRCFYLLRPALPVHRRVLRQAPTEFVPKDRQR